MPESLALRLTSAEGEVYEVALPTPEGAHQAARVAAELAADTGDHGVTVELVGCTCHYWPPCLGTECEADNFHDPFDAYGGDCEPDWSGIPACPFHVVSFGRAIFGQ